MKKYFSLLLGVMCLGMITIANAERVVVKIYKTSPKGVGAPIGTITVKELQNGLLFVPNLSDLSPGEHGFHVHQKGSCLNSGKAAGGHYDPEKTNKHLGPYNDAGHKGDLPVMQVDSQGRAIEGIIDRRLTLADIQGRTLMIHAGGDNYSDTPKKLGGGGARIACGIVPKAK